MSLYLYFVKDSQTKIWGLTPRQRAQKVLGDQATTIPDISVVQPSDHVLILRGDYIFEDRLLRHLAASPDTLLLVQDRHNKVPVAIHVPGTLAGMAVKIIENGQATGPIKSVTTHSLETISVAFHQKLRKFEPPFVLRVNDKDRERLEQRLFNWSYKGVTDLVTKWLWPRPARWAVKQCVRLKLQPNHITLMGLFLVLLAGYLFAKGYLGWGLLAGWLMTFLDTVDGKLARVTVTSSRFGHYFDHIIDIVHPPIWYLLWGMGLEQTGQFHLNTSLGTLYWVIFVGYIIGRLVEGLFQWLIADFGIFCWRPLDSFFRLITARRNPCMIILTLSYLAGRPDWGLFLVAFWTAITSLFLLIRLGYAFYQKTKKGQLKSWLEEIDFSSQQKGLAIRWFTRHDTV